MINKQIRLEILRLLQTHGPLESRYLTRALAVRFNTTRQRIAGNLSSLYCRQGLIDIHSLDSRNL
jgi:predicted transcriptional regulator